jgi:hypothetical protein
MLSSLSRVAGFTKLIMEASAHSGPELIKTRMTKCTPVWSAKILQTSALKFYMRY